MYPDVSMSNAPWISMSAPPQDFHPVQSSLQRSGPFPQPVTSEALWLHSLALTSKDSIKDCKSGFTRKTRPGVPPQSGPEKAAKPTRNRLDGAVVHVQPVQGQGQGGG